MLGEAFKKIHLIWALFQFAQKVIKKRTIDKHTQNMKKIIKIH